MVLLHTLEQENLATADTLFFITTCFVFTVMAAIDTRWKLNFLLETESGQM